MRTFPVFPFTVSMTLVGCLSSQPSVAEEPGKQSATYRLSSEGKDESGPHYARARELYDLGPAKAEEIIAELDLELRENPDSLRALGLKANTQIGTGQYEAAMATLDRYDEIARKATTISPNGILLRARCLYHMGNYESAKRKLEPYWAFFQDDSAIKSKYDSLMSAIVAELPAAQAK